MKTNNKTVDWVRINDQIRENELRVIDDQGELLGIMSSEEAVRLAKDKSLDLIEISPKAIPPVAKIMDYGKFLYQQKKKASQIKAKAHSVETKVIQVKMATGEHDLTLKAKKISGWLKSGHRVKIDLFLIGRAKYMDKKFLEERLERILHLITEKYKVAEPAKKSPKGLTIIVEKDK